MDFKKYLVELIGTFFLVFTIVMAVNTLPAGFAIIAIASVLMVMIYAGGHISGAHYNPAVTLAVWMRGKCAASDIPGYMISQFLGAVVASLAAGYFLGEAAPSDPGKLDVLPSLLAEVIGTFALVYVILNVATAKGTEGNSFYGLAIGFTVGAMAYAVGGVSGGAFNPAVAVGVTMSGMAQLADIWIFLVANFAAAALAAVIFKFVNGDD